MANMMVMKMNVMISSLEQLHSTVVSNISSLLKELGVLKSSSLEYALI